MKRFTQVVAGLLVGILLISVPAVAVEAAGIRDLFDRLRGRQQTAAPAAIGGSGQYPMNTDVTLTIFSPTAANWAQFLSNYGESAFSKALVEQTGVNVEWINPPLNEHVTAFTLMVASGDFPDIIEWTWTREYLGGAVGAIADGVIIPLNEPMEKWAPNYMAFLDANPRLRKQAVTDDSTHFAFPFWRNDDLLKSTSGPIVRKDWLDDLGLDVPETIEDWDAMLKAFRDEKGATNGFTGASSAALGPAAIYHAFGPAFNIRIEDANSFYVDGDKALHGFSQPGFRDFLELMAYWYGERLIDQDIFTVNATVAGAAMTSGSSGAGRGAGGGNLGPWITTGQANDPDGTFDLTAARIPTFDKNVYSRFGGTSNDIGDQSPGHAAISTRNRNVELTTRFLDYAYSEAGHLLHNFGVEGVSFNMVAGIPTYTDEVMKNPEGRTFAQALTYHARSAFSGPFDQDPWYLRQFYAMEQQKQALDYWRQLHNAEETMWPPVSNTVAEAATISARMSEINTFRMEQAALFISGAQPINNATWKHYIDTIESMGIADVLAIQQAALDRYNAR
jgi:putative aldouronate transport system substrate-binding protein